MTRGRPPLGFLPFLPSVFLGWTLLCALWSVSPVLLAPAGLSLEGDALFSHVFEVWGLSVTCPWRVEVPWEDRVSAPAVMVPVAESGHRTVQEGLGLLVARGPEAKVWAELSPVPWGCPCWVPWRRRASYFRVH